MRMTELGLAGLLVPETYGGSGLGVLDAALVAEVLGSGSVPGALLGHLLATCAVTEGGSTAQQQRWLPELAAGRLTGSIALGEPNGAWTPQQWGTEVRDGCLAGTKSFVLGGRLADVIVVGTAGGGLALVERQQHGVRLEAFDGVDRTRRLDHLTLEGAPCEVLEHGPAAARRVFDAGLVLLAADAFGGAWKLIEMSVEYAKTRVQFGQPIAQFQAVKHRLVDMALNIEPARALYWYAAYAADALPDESPRAAALAKAHLTDRFMQVARDAVEVHGGIGFTWECDVQLWYKRAMFDRAFLGTPEFHRERCAQLARW